MILDIIGGVLLLLLFIRGYRQGFIVAVFSLLAVLVGVVCALKLSHALAGFLADRGIITASWGLLVSYVVLFLLAMWGVRLVADMIEKTFRAMSLGFFNNLSGGLIYAAAGVILWSGGLWLGHNLHLISPEMRNASHTYDYILPVAPWAFDGLGAIWPLAKDVFAYVGDFFGELNKKLGDYVGAG